MLIRIGFMSPLHHKISFLCSNCFIITTVCILSLSQNVCVTAAKFLAHLVNQQVLHELVALELLTVLLEDPTDDGVEVAIGFLKESGQKLTEVCMF